MKTNSIIKSALIAAGFSAIAFIGNAQAQVVNVDINTASSANYSGVGAASDTGTFWNAMNITSGAGHTATVSNLQDSTNSTNTGLSLTLDAGSLVELNSLNASSNPTTIAPALLDDFAYQGANDPYTFTIGGLTASDTYNLFLYSQNAGFDSGGAAFTIGSTTLDAKNTVPDGSAFISGGNYVEFTGLTADGSGNITGTVTALVNNLNGNATVNYLNGLQIVNTTPATPEPTSLALIGLGALALLISRRRTA